MPRGKLKATDLKRILNIFSGSDVNARTRRGFFWTIVDFGANGILIRFVSNLILTRLLFPEAFGIMTLAQTFLTGLEMFSDTGIRVSIMQNERGDDPAFLNTAWTMQILRGAMLWGMIFLIAGPVARLYDTPVLAQVLPAMGLSIFLKGFMPTAAATANRHLQLGRVTAIALALSVVQLVLASIFAYFLQSVWALVIAINLRTLLGLAAHWSLLPNASNRLQIERAALDNLFHFGKFVFLSTAAQFVISQSDRAILGLYIPIAALGVFNIGFFMAMAPFNFASALQSKVIFPLYRLRPIEESEENRRKIFRTRRLLVGTMLLGSLAISAIGPWLVDLLYDHRYGAAGPMITLFSLSLVPLITLGPIGSMLLAMGDSKRLLVLQLLTAALQSSLLFGGIHFFGVVGAILAPGAAMLLSFPLRIRYAQRYNAWDPVQDLVMTGLGLMAAFAICFWHWELLLPLLP